MKGFCIPGRASLYFQVSPKSEIILNLKKQTLPIIYQCLDNLLLPKYVQAT